MRHMMHYLKMRDQPTRFKHTNLSAKYGDRLCIQTDPAYYELDPFSAHSESCSDPLYFVITGRKGFIRNGSKPGMLLLGLWQGEDRRTKNAMHHYSVNRMASSVGGKTGTSTRIHFHEYAFEEMLAFIKPFASKQEVLVSSGRRGQPLLST